MYEIYTDGSCRRNTKTGGYGYIVVKDDEIIERFVKKELKDRYDLYDKIISYCMVKFYSFSKDNVKIILIDCLSKCKK